MTANTSNEAKTSLLIVGRHVYSVCEIDKLERPHQAANLVCRNAKTIQPNNRLSCRTHQKGKAKTCEVCFTLKGLFEWILMNRTHCFAPPAQIAMRPPCHRPSSCSITTNERCFFNIPWLPTSRFGWNSDRCTTSVLLYSFFLKLIQSLHNHHYEAPVFAHMQS